jgi:glycosyltransferase involved in cell wall biosynthesis
MLKQPLVVAWISDFPVEWLPDLPEPLRALPRQHPATWQMTLLSEFEKEAALRLHVILLRKHVARDISFERQGVTFHILKTPPLMRLGSLFWLDTFLIRRICRRIKPDLLHAWGSEKGAMLIAGRLGYPYVATVQGLLSWYKTITPLTPGERLLEFLEKRSLPRAPIVTAESVFTVQYLRDHYPHMRVCHSEHVCPWTFHQVRRRPQTDPLHFISNGTPGYRKGTDLLFKALDQLTAELPFRLTVIGRSNPGYMQSQRAAMSENFWKRIEFKHNLQPHEIARELETPTMMLLPTRVDTGPMAVKEAAVAGVPVVASQVGGIPDYLIHGRNGFMFPAGDLPGFVRAIRDACAHRLFGQGLVDPEALAQTRVCLSPARMARDFLSAYEVALAASTNTRKQ